MSEAGGLQAMMAGAVAREMRLARAGALRGIAVTREPRADESLPRPLQGFAPARLWADTTIALWERLQAGPERALRGAIVSLDTFATLVIDMMLMTGATPWNDPAQGYVVFGGARVSPDPIDVRLSLLVEPMRFTDDGNPWEMT